MNTLIQRLFTFGIVLIFSGVALAQTQVTQSNPQTGGIFGQTTQNTAQQRPTGFNRFSQQTDQQRRTFWVGRTDSVRAGGSVRYSTVVVGPGGRPERVNVVCRGGRCGTASPSYVHTYKRQLRQNVRNNRSFTRTTQRGIAS